MKSEKIQYSNQTLWASAEALNDPMCETFAVYEDKELKIPYTSYNKEPLHIIKCESESLNEAGGGAGYATWGGGGGFGNPSVGRSFYGRGFGFGSSNSGSGSYSMYTYDIKPLNKSLEPQNANNDDGMQMIHIGSVVKGKILGKKKHITGQIQSIEQDDNNNIKYYLVRDPDTAMTKKLDPTTVFLWEPENEGPHPGASDIPSMSGALKANESFFSTPEPKHISTMDDASEEEHDDFKKRVIKQVFDRPNEFLNKHDIINWEDDLLTIHLKYANEKIFSKAKYYSYKIDFEKKQLTSIVYKNITNIPQGIIFDLTNQELENFENKFYWYKNKNEGFYPRLDEEINGFNRFDPMNLNSFERGSDIKTNLNIGEDRTIDFHDGDRIKLKTNIFKDLGQNSSVEDFKTKEIPGFTRIFTKNEIARYEENYKMFKNVTGSAFGGEFIDWIQNNKDKWEFVNENFERDSDITKSLQIGDHKPFQKREIIDPESIGNLNIGDKVYFEYDRDLAAIGIIRSIGDHVELIITDSIDPDWVGTHQYTGDDITVMKINEELSGSEAVYGFAGWLTTRDEKTVMGSTSDCANIADKIDSFCKANDLIEPSDDWHKELNHPKEVNEYMDFDDAMNYTNKKFGGGPEGMSATEAWQFVIDNQNEDGDFFDNAFEMDPDIVKKLLFKWAIGDEEGFHYMFHTGNELDPPGTHKIDESKK